MNDRELARLKKGDRVADAAGREFAVVSVDRRTVHAIGVDESSVVERIAYSAAELRRLPGADESASALELSALERRWPALALELLAALGALAEAGLGLGLVSVTFSADAGSARAEIWRGWPGSEAAEAGVKLVECRVGTEVRPDGGD